LHDCVHINVLYLVPVTNNWRGELRELCEKAGLITDDLPPSPLQEAPPRSPSGRRSVYSGIVSSILGLFVVRRGGRF